jgi:hypothetical protein
MEQLFVLGAPRRRSPAGTAISAGLHLAVAIGGVSVTGAAVERALPPPQASITFLISAAPPSVALASASIRHRADVVGAPPRRSAPLDPPVTVRHASHPEPPAPADPVPDIVTSASLSTGLPIVPSEHKEAPRATVSVGAFDRTPGTQSHGGAPAVVVEAGFNRVDDSRVGPDVRGAVHTAGFDLAPPAARAHAVIALAERVDTPVEILFKPSP